MAASAERFGLEFWAWCLMKNHVHFLVVPRKADSLASRLDRRLGALPVGWPKGKARKKGK